MEVGLLNREEFLDEVASIMRRLDILAECCHANPMEAIALKGAESFLKVIEVAIHPPEHFLPSVPVETSEHE